MPTWLVALVKQRCPGLLNPNEEPRDSEATWLAISAWADEHVFNGARDGGWLEALHFYCGRDSRSEAVWEAWERSASEWRHSRPAAYPGFEEWHSQALESTRVGPQFTKLVNDYIEAEAFAFGLARDRGIRWRNNCGIKCRCRYSLSGLQLAMDPEREPTNLGMMLWRKTLACLEEHMLEASDTTAPIDAIRAAARGHLRAERIAAYWAECGSNWTKSRPDRYPTFKEWLQQADAFVAST